MEFTRHKIVLGNNNLPRVIFFIIFNQNQSIKFYIFISVKKDHINIFLLRITTFMYSFDSQYLINFLIIGFIYYDFRLSQTQNSNWTSCLFKQDAM